MRRRRQKERERAILNPRTLEDYLLLEKIKEEFENIGYDKSFEILKPF